MFIHNFVISQKRASYDIYRSNANINHFVHLKCPIDLIHLVRKQNQLVFINTALPIGFQFRNCIVYFIFL